MDATRRTTLAVTAIVAGGGLLLLSLLAAAWSNSADLGHAWAVPVLMAFLWWERWAERPVTAAPRDVPRWLWAIAALVVLLAVPVRLLTIPYPLLPTLLAGSVVGAAAVAALGAWLIAGREGLRWTLPPLVLLVSALPTPSVIESGLIVPMREVFASIVAELANLFGRPALATGTSIRLATGWVGIDEACGGIRSLQACVMIGLFFGEWYRFGWARRAGLLGLSVGFAVAGNFFRILFLAWRAGEGEAAVLAAHDVAGWAAMVASVTVTGWLAIKWAGYRLPQPVIRREARPALTALHPGWIWLGVIVGALALNEASARAWYFRGARAQSEVPQWSVRWPTALPTYQAEGLGDVARDMLRPNGFAAARWALPSGEWVWAYYVQWTQGQVARFVPFLHNPTVCLPLSGCELLAEEEPIELQVSGNRLVFNTYRFRRAGTDMLVTFVIWDSARGQPLLPTDGSNRAAWDHRWRDVREGRQHQPAQLFSVALDSNGNARAQMRTILQSMVVSSR
ncbi:MAG: exosortase/archaeosortase family protein [Candidatus Didemnitutus sp.]|nr:exosortase/archaeosortase family protein [Candidatus Didemnitutus sp.]